MVSTLLGGFFYQLDLRAECPADKRKEKQRYRFSHMILLYDFMSENDAID